MKKLIMVLALITAGCATGPNVTKKTPVEVAIAVCPSLTTTISSLQNLIGLDKSVVTALSKASNIVNDVCVMPSTATSLSLEDIRNDAIPTITAAIKISNLSDYTKNQLTLAITVAQLVLSETSIK